MLIGVWYKIQIHVARTVKLTPNCLPTLSEASDTMQFLASLTILPSPICATSFRLSLTSETPDAVLVW